MADVQQISDDSFQTEVLQASLPVLIDFWAPWCGPCRAIAPIVEELAGTYSGKLKVVKMNVDDNPNTPAKYGVRGIPNLIIFKGGTVQEQIVGAVPEDPARQGDRQSRRLDEPSRSRPPVASRSPRRISRPLPGRRDGIRCTRSGVGLTARRVRMAARECEHSSAGRLKGGNHAFEDGKRMFVVMAVGLRAHESAGSGARARLRRA